MFHIKKNPDIYYFINVFASIYIKIVIDDDIKYTKVIQSLYIYSYGMEFKSILPK